MTNVAPTRYHEGEVLAVIMGGGQGSRLFPLTKERSKPAVPLAGKYRLVDIPISNCINSGIRKIYLLFPVESYHCRDRDKEVFLLSCAVHCGGESGYDGAGGNYSVQEDDARA